MCRRSRERRTDEDEKASPVTCRKQKTIIKVFPLNTVVYREMLAKLREYIISNNYVYLIPCILYGVSFYAQPQKFNYVCMSITLFSSRYAVVFAFPVETNQRIDKSYLNNNYRNNN